MPSSSTVGRLIQSKLLNLKKGSTIELSTGRVVWSKEKRSVPVLLSLIRTDADQDFENLLILFLTSILSLYLLYSYNNIVVALFGFALLGIGSSAIVPIAYSLAGKVDGIDSGAAIAIVSIAVYGTFMGAPASLGIIANKYGVNSIFFPILLIFLFVLPIIFASKKHFKK